MESIDISNERVMKIECTSKGTRNGFYHEARLIGGCGETIHKTRVHYVNRTWEQYEFQTVKRKLIEEAVEAEVRKQQKIMGIKRLTKAKCEEIINYSSTIQQIKSLCK